MIRLRARHNTQQATLLDSVIELLPDTDSGPSKDELLGPGSDLFVEVLPHERGETETALDQSTPWRRHPSQQRGGRGARRVTFGDTRLEELGEKAATSAQEGDTSSDSEVQVVTDSESEQGYNRYPAHPEYSADPSESSIGARRVTVGDTFLRESGEKATTFAQEGDTTSDDCTIESEQSYDGYPARAEYSVNRSDSSIGEADLYKHAPPSTLGTKTSAEPFVSVDKLCASVDQLREQPPSNPVQ